ncbi:hypothetical protein RirG_053490 [Rhizophagus irregularis DAOM 197198w]|uniref:FLYWCH-type domain-containing protein n=1 Tax=Rhizophagus irregularis (strain DAOM 197198w) TaxID=1432141 RepID=A0A015JXF5_RHIIW|nr:hypothetical protein RirG_053490 [Rhizophagus irregularis DAOM 197198w]
MDEVCDIVPSNKGNNKINVRGYLMVKERNREAIFYWCCAKRKSEGCKGRAVTTLCNNLHYLRSCTDHNHAPQASDAGVAKLTAQIKLFQKKFILTSHHLMLFVEQLAVLENQKCHLSHKILLK